VSRNASAGESPDVDRCGAPTGNGEPCELPASRADGRCHLHTDAANDRPTPALDDRDAMLATLDVGIEQAREKIQGGRIRDENKEKIRVKWVRALAYIINVRAGVANDRDLEDLTERIEEIEEQQDGI
jgi:hypothetical protein